MSTLTDPSARIGDLARRALERSKYNKQNVELENKVILFPKWAKSQRGVPNVFLRSALFGIKGKNKKRNFLDNITISSLSNFKITYSGPQLDQNDLDCWEEIINIVIKENAFDGVIGISRYRFLKSIGRKTGSTQYEQLDRIIKRLSGAIITVNHGHLLKFDGLIKGGEFDTKTKKYILKVNMDTLELYCSDGWSKINWEERIALLGHPLAQWLHGFYSTHAKPIPYKVTALRSLCGSNAKDINGYRSNLREALKVLQAVTRWKWIIDDYDRLHIKRKPTKSQAKHLQNHGINDSA